MLPAGWFPVGLAANVECRDDNGDYQPSELVIHRVLNARVIVAQQRPFHRPYSGGRHVRRRYRERATAVYVPVCRLPHQMHPLGVMLAPWQEAS